MTILKYILVSFFLLFIIFLIPSTFVVFVILGMLTYFFHFNKKDNHSRSSTTNDLVNSYEGSNSPSEYEEDYYIRNKHKYMHDLSMFSEQNFLNIHHPYRNKFFAGNYFNKEKDGRFGVLRKITIIEPVYIEYINKENHHSKRKVEIFGIKTHGDSLYFYGFCHLRGVDRNFNPECIKVLIDKNGNRYTSDNIYDFIKNHLFLYINNEYNKKIVLNCFNKL